MVVRAEYRLAGECVGFMVGSYDPREPLVIDPVVAYATDFGGQGED